MPRLTDVPVLFLLFFPLAATAHSAAPTLQQLEGILDRAITMMGAFVGDGVPFSPGFGDNLLLLQQVLPLGGSTCGVVCSNSPARSSLVAVPLLLHVCNRCNPCIRSAPLSLDASRLSGDQKPPSPRALPSSPPIQLSPSRPCPPSS
jgi:hypothetical protein